MKGAGHWTLTMLDKIDSFRLVVIDEKFEGNDEFEHDLNCSWYNGSKYFKINTLALEI